MLLHVVRKVKSFLYTAKNIKEELAQNYRSYQQNVDNLKSKNKNFLRKRPSSASAKIDTRNPK